MNRHTEAVIKVLERAKSHLHQARWAQGALDATTPGCTCLLMSINTAGWETGAGVEITKAARGVVEMRLGTDDLAAWNDVEGRTKAQVMQALKGTITALKATR